MEYGEDEWTRNIHKQTSKMSRMVADLVTLSRLDEENPFLERTEFSLSDAVWEVAEPFASLAKAQGKKYSQRIEENLTLCGNPDATRQMISVLLDNAMKYSCLLYTSCPGGCVQGAGRYLRIQDHPGCTRSSGYFRIHTLSSAAPPAEG